MKQILTYSYFQLRQIASATLSSSTPYKSSLSLINQDSLSDFFYWCDAFESIEFVAENIYALLLKKPVQVKHIFKFYSPQGVIIASQCFASKNYFDTFELNPGPKLKESLGALQYASFTHKVQHTLKISDLPLLPIRKKYHCIHQCRGYTKFFPSTKQKGFAAVHGNFGAITGDYKSCARQSVPFTYTPAYLLDSSCTYDLVFNNPTTKQLDFKVHGNGISTSSSIPSFGTDSVRINDYSGIIHIDSRLPIFRPLIIKNPQLNELANLDIFHG